MTPKPRAAGKPETIPAPTRRRADRHPLDPPAPDAGGGLDTESAPDPTTTAAPAPGRASEDASDASPEAPQRAAAGPGGARRPQRSGKAATKAQKGSQGPAKATEGGMAIAWELDQATRSYLGGLLKLSPRVQRLARAIEAFIDAGGSPDDIRARLAVVGIPAESIPAEIREAIEHPPASQ